MLPKSPSCLGCPAFHLGIGYVPPRGPSPAPLALVGQGPGEDEVILGEPFVGKSGKKLSRWLREAGVEEKELHIDNIVRCRLVIRDRDGLPVLSSGGNVQNRTPSAAEVGYCWPRHGLPALKDALAGQPRPTTIACGVPATSTLLGRRAKAGFAGNVFEVELP